MRRPRRADRVHGRHGSSASRSHEGSAARSHAKATGDARAYRGRKPSYSQKAVRGRRALLGQAKGIGDVARITGLTRQTVYRIKDDVASVEAALATWGI